MRRLITVLLGITLGAAATAGARWPSDAPPLPPPDPGVFTVVDVDTAQELADACWNLASNQAIVIAPGTYDLSAVVFPNGIDGRLTVGRYGAPSISNVQIRGATGDPADVVLHGAGMTDPIVPFGFQIFTATDVLIADLTIGSVYYHAVAIQNDQGATRVRLYHCRLHDAGEQIVKGNRGASPGAADVVIEYCEVSLSDGAIVHPDLGYCYTNAIDAIGGQRWVIRDNLIRGIWCQDGDLAGPAVLMWQGSADTVVERNVFVDCSRGVSLGLVSPQDHTGGVVRNNFLRWNPQAGYTVDVPIYTTSPGAAIFHNSVLTHGLYDAAVEVRYAGATGVEVRGNLMDGAVRARDGAAPLVVDNITDADPGWFVDESAGDLHLLPAAAAAIDQLDPLPACSDDFDGAARPATAGAVDVGADELEGPLFADGFEAGDTSAWTLTMP
ncbi:MAG TPA: hypothetical protein PKJ99_04740 [Thermoanaerobaculales bacterium]|nr:hypothetical protein [Thermoanaerobaculales bacterium]HPA81306.1 hypothetical protein [Thermoanaerobaculales bacterium]HQL30253.1 hypothetical protein [Thermoanaerobaculales bacterium]HQN97076.1 hypothetical protein [Thermoanaerobaculales bacterium]HQP42447.1 hypothetical protein [Thermoanaerobaculales bacterium]